MTEILDLKMIENDADARTIREYLARLVWAGMGEKRPFGNSDWYTRELLGTLAERGVVEATRDQWGYWELASREAADELIERAVGELGTTPAFSRERLLAAMETAHGAEGVAWLKDAFGELDGAEYRPS